MPLTQALDENIQQARMGVMTLICTLYFFSLALYPFNSLFSAQMKEVKPLTCLPVPLSAASNVSGKFQPGQTKINTKHRVPEVAGTAQHHPCQTKGVYLISHQMRSSLGSLLTRVRSLHCRPLWDVVPQYYCFLYYGKIHTSGKSIASSCLSGTNFTRYMYKLTKWSDMISHFLDLQHGLLCGAHFHWYHARILCV